MLRKMVIHHSMLQNFSTRHDRLSEIIKNQMQKINGIQAKRSSTTSPHTTSIDMKPNIMYVQIFLLNIFVRVIFRRMMRNSNK